MAILAFEKLGLFLRLKQRYLAEDDRDANHISVDYSCAYGALYRYVEDRCAGLDATGGALYGYGLWSKGVNGRHTADALHSGHHRRCILQAHSDWKVVAKLLPTAILGFFVAIFIDKLIPTNEFRQLMGWTLALALAVMIWSELFGKENRWVKKWWYSATFGLLGGFTAMICTR